MYKESWCRKTSGTSFPVGFITRHWSHIQVRFCDYFSDMQAIDLHTSLNNVNRQLVLSISKRFLNFNQYNKNHDLALLLLFLPQMKSSLSAIIGDRYGAITVQLLKKIIVITHTSVFFFCLILEQHCFFHPPFKSSLSEHLLLGPGPIMFVTGTNTK